MRVRIEPVRAVPVKQNPQVWGAGPPKCSRCMDTGWVLQGGKAVPCYCEQAAPWPETGDDQPTEDYLKNQLERNPL